MVGKNERWCFAAVGSHVQQGFADASVMHTAVMFRQLAQLLNPASVQNFARMDTYDESYVLPITPLAMKAIQTTLQNHDPFCAFLSEIDCYDVLTFRRQQAHHGTKTFALFDRNILEDVLSVVRPAAAGQETECSKRGRIGAAVMCFLQSCNAIIEPSISLYENPTKALEDLSLFRRADNVDATIYAQIALGILDTLPCRELPPPPSSLPQVDFTNR